MSHAIAVALADMFGSGPQFSPLQLVPRGWWSASSVTQSSGRVTAVADLSGNNRNASLASAYQPLYTANDPSLGSQPSVLNDQTAAATGGGLAVTISLSPPITIYWMGYCTTGGTNQTSPDIFSVNVANGRLHAGNPTSVLSVNGAGNVANFNATLATKTILCVTMDGNGGRCDVWLNSVLTSAGNVTATGTIFGGTFNMLNAQGTVNNGAALGDVIVYTGLHTSANRAKVMGWGATKYGVTLT